MHLILSAERDPQGVWQLIHSNFSTSAEGLCIFLLLKWWIKQCTVTYYEYLWYQNISQKDFSDLGEISRSQFIQQAIGV